VQLGFLIIAICETKGSSLGASPVNLESPLDTQPARVSFNAESPHYRTTALPHHRTTDIPVVSVAVVGRPPERRSVLGGRTQSSGRASTASVFQQQQSAEGRKRRRARAQLSISKVTFPPVSWTSALFTEFIPSSLCQDGL
jgi:hypothetical protein